MSDGTERPTGAEGAGETDPDAWATACEEDLAAERARRRERYGTPPSDAAAELRRFADAVADTLARFGAPFAGAAAQGAAQGVARQLFDQAKAAARPVIERNPRVFDHLAAAGQELLAAYHAAVREQEHRWTRGGPGSGVDKAVDAPATDRPRDAAQDAARDGDEAITGTAHTDGAAGDEPPDRPADGDDGPAGTQRIDLD